MLISGFGYSTKLIKSNFSVFRRDNKSVKKFACKFKFETYRFNIKVHLIVYTLYI